ncbi:MAG: putative hydrolase MhqD [Bacteroidota bacterium]|jgi:phospholipase/carboxylesterase
MHHQHIWQQGTGDRVWILFHGTGGTESDLIPLVRRIDVEGSILGIRGNVSEHGMARFFRRLAEGVFDVEDIRRRTADLAVFLDAMQAEHGFDAARSVALGYSNGANIISALNFLEPGRFDASVLMRPMVPIAPVDGADLAGSRVLMLVGERDPLSPPGEPDRLEAIYRRLGADVAREEIAAGHELTSADLQHIAAWL